ncbi:MAG: outer membrane beta-barrel protein, partial [Melioribacteraceae bacterium]|nr:outer membrane beta-barrel protein [Melioribacteraceae bacterium]
AGVAYGTNIGSVGISVNGLYSLNEKIQIAPSFIYFLESDFVTWSVINVDGHYKFSSTEGFDIYGIAGLGITMASFTYDLGIYGGEISETSSNFGVNLGVGASKKIGTNLDLFGEAKYQISSGSFLTINAGVLYNF